MWSSGSRKLIMKIMVFQQVSSYLTGKEWMLSVDLIDQISARKMTNQIELSLEKVGPVKSF